MPHSTAASAMQTLQVRLPLFVLVSGFAKSTARCVSRARVMPRIVVGATKRYSRSSSAIASTPVQMGTGRSGGGARRKTFTTEEGERTGTGSVWGGGASRGVQVIQVLSVMTTAGALALLHSIRPLLVGCQLYLAHCLATTTLGLIRTESAQRSHGCLPIWHGRSPCHVISRARMRLHALAGEPAERAAVPDWGPGTAAHNAWECSVTGRGRGVGRRGVVNGMWMMPPGTPRRPTIDVPLATTRRFHSAVPAGRSGVRRADRLVPLSFCSEWARPKIQARQLAPLLTVQWRSAAQTSLASGTNTFRHMSSPATTMPTICLPCRSTRSTRRRGAR